MKFYIKCRRCESQQPTERTKDIYKTTHHLECDWCPNCESAGDDYWECFNCSETGELIDE